MKSLIKPCLTCLVILGSLVGCAETIQERDGAHLHIVPITNTYHLTIKPKKERHAWDQLYEYVEQQWNVIANEKVAIEWSSKAGKRMADKLSKQLQKDGISADMIVINQSESKQESHFDISVSTVKYKVVTELCDYTTIGQFGSYHDGCYAENARWQSMVHPEKMLLGQELEK